MYFVRVAFVFSLLNGVELENLDSNEIFFF